MRGSRPEARSVILPAGQIRLHAKVWDAVRPSLPPLVVLHGIFEDWRSFAAVAGELAGERTVYNLDLRGHGRSDRPARGYRFVDYAEDVLTLLDRFGDAEVDLLGHSLGANVALFAASAGHSALGRIIAIDPPILLAEDWPAVRDMMRREWRTSRLPVDDIVAEMAKNLRRPRVWLQMLATALTDTADGVFAAMAGEEQGNVNWADVLGRITVPTLAIAADPAKQGAQLVGHRLTTLRRGIPHAEIEFAPNAAHHVEMDQPVWLHRVVERFLRAGRQQASAA